MTLESIRAVEPWHRTVGHSSAAIHAKHNSEKNINQKKINQHSDRKSSAFRMVALGSVLEISINMAVWFLDGMFSKTSVCVDVHVFRFVCVCVYACTCV